MKWDHGEGFVQLSKALLLMLLLLMATACSSTKALVVLLPEEGAAKGSVVVGEGDKATILDEPMTAAKVDNRGRIKKEPFTQAEVEREFGRALAAQPPEPIRFLIYFYEDSTSVLDDSKETLRELFAEVARRQAVEVQLTGHTDFRRNSSGGWAEGSGSFWYQPLTASESLETGV